MESNIFSGTLQRLFKNAVHNNFNNYPIEYHYNISNYVYILTDQEDAYIDKLKHKSEIAKEQRESDNYHLYKQTIHYWAILCGASLLFFAMEMGCRYIIFRRKHTTIQKSISIESGLEMIEYENVRLRTRSFSDSLDEIPPKAKEESFINWKKVRKVCMYNTLHYSVLVVLIVGFEYWFFNEVILEYKIVSIQELEYDVALVMKPFVNNFISNYVDDTW